MTDRNQEDRTHENEDGQLNGSGEPAERYSLAAFDFSDMIRCGARLRTVAADSACMEDAAQRVVDYLRGALVGPLGESACALVRCFKTHPLGSLPEELAAAARGSLGAGVPEADRETEAIPCLTLLGSSGELPEWSSRHGSRGHRAIPLASLGVLDRAPMIGQLIGQMGLSPGDVMRPTTDFLLDAEQRAFNVFHVPEARGSAYVPAQDFVTAHGVRSVLGFGGLLPSGDFFAVILFSRVAIPREVADMFRTIALSTKLVLLPFTRGPIFTVETGRAGIGYDQAAQERQRAEIATLHLLIAAFENVALQQTAKLKLAMREAQQSARDVRRLNAVLERRVEERTADLLASNEELKEFSYSVSHDLRAPLRAIDGFSAALEEDYGAQLDEGARTYVRRIRTGAQRMGQLIDAMLGLAKVTRAEISRSEVDLSALAASIAGELLETHPERVVQFEIEPGLRVEGDPHLLRSMLENLLGNSFKFTSGTAEAQIRFGWSGEQRAFFVADNGAGFDMRNSSKLFRVFSRLHSSEEFEGHGVGLATVERIVRRHGGSLWATARVGEGATFWFRLGQGRE